MQLSEIGTRQMKYKDLRFQKYVCNLNVSINQTYLIK